MQLINRVFRLWVLFAVLSGGANANPSLLRLPEGLSAAEWQDIRRQIESSIYGARQTELGFAARNIQQGWDLTYGNDGWTSIAPSASGKTAYHINLKLEAVGYGKRLESLTRPEQILSTRDSRIEYRWNKTLSEWWLNGPFGIEQGFDLSERPFGSRSGEALTIAMKLDTDLGARLDAQSLQLVSHDGAVRIGYGKLRAWDAHGKELSARMTLDGARLSLQIDDRDALYPLTIDPVFAQQAYLKASNTDAGDQFGFSLALSGDTLVVGAIGEASNATGEADNSATDAGAAHVFVRAGATWSQQAYLKASNTDAGDRFGWSVALSGDTLVVGAVFEDSNATGEADNSAVDSGAAYVFVRSGSTWSQQAYLKASNTDAGDWFGFSVALSGDTLVVGAQLEDSNATDVNGDAADNSASDAGAAYVFVRSGTSWSQQAYLKASNTEADDRFGFSVDLSGDTLLVGARFEDSNTMGVNGDAADNSASDAGAAYVFVRSGTSWSQQAYLKASNTGAGDRFGFSVALSGDTLVVGARGERSNATGVDGNQVDDSVEDAGAAYVFVRFGTTWSQQAYLKASNTDAGDKFGYSVALSGDRLVVGAPEEDSNAMGMNGNPVDNSATNSGSAYVFVRSGTSWSQQGYLKASNTDSSDEFGYSVALSGDTLVVAAPFEASNAMGVNGEQTNNFAPDAGAAYVFKTNYTIGGTVSGLSGTGLVLQNNGGDNLAIAANGAFAFPTALADGSAYNVTVQTHPGGPSQACTVGNGSGMVVGADVTSVTVSCTTNTYTIGGTVSGLAGTGLVLQNNGGDNLSVTANGAFTFATALPDLSAYNVTLQTQPTGPSQACTVTNGSGNLAGANVTHVAITCQSFTLQLSMDQVDYGSVAIGIGGTSTVTLSNVGNTSANVVALAGKQSSAAPIHTAAVTDLIISSLNGPGAPFAISGGTCGSTPITLALGTSCTLDIAFNPTATGQYQSSIEVVSNAQSSPDTINLSGVAIFGTRNPVPTLDGKGLALLIASFALIALFGLRGRLMRQETLWKLKTIWVGRNKPI